MKKQDGILEQIFDRIDTVAQVQQGLPQQLDNLERSMKGIAKDAADQAVARHKADCAAALNFGKVADRTAENTGVLKTLRDTGSIRRSVAPAARALRLDKVPPVVWKLILIIGIGIAGKFGWDGGADVIRLLTGTQAASAGEVSDRN